jgi:hypothetical protein
MVSMILLFALAADDPPPLRLMTGTVVEVDGFTFTVANAKTRKTFRLNAETTIIYDGVRAKTREEVEIRVKDRATVTYDFESNEPRKVQITSDKVKADKKTEEKATDEEEAERKADRDARKAEREKEREEKAIEEVKRQDEAFAKAHDAKYQVRELAGGALGFGPFRTRFCEMHVKAVKRNDGRIDLTMSIIDPDEKPRSMPAPKRVGMPGPPSMTKGPKGSPFKNSASEKLVPPPGPPSFQAPPDLTSLPSATLWLPPRFEFEGRVSSVHSGYRGSRESKSDSKPEIKKGKKANPNPDDPSEIPTIVELLEKQITGESNESSRAKTNTSFSISLRFIASPDVVVKPDDRIEMRFDQWIFRFNDENNPKALEAFNEIFERFRQEQ